LAGGLDSRILEIKLSAFFNSAGGSGKSLKTLQAILVLGIRTAQAVIKIATK
jgi:hypothetical protein